MYEIYNQLLWRDVRSMDGFRLQFSSMLPTPFEHEHENKTANGKKQLRTHTHTHMHPLQIAVLANEKTSENVRMYYLFCVSE